MAAVDAIAALNEHWDEVQELLGEDARARLAGYIEDLADARDDADLAEAAGVIADLLYEELPQGDPVKVAVAKPQTRLVRIRDWRSIAALLIGKAQPIRQWAQAWLLAMPAAPVDQVQVDAEPDLIRLVRPDGSVHVPAFQFDSAGQPLRVVIEVNRVLDAAEDPWGAADWWLGPNAWLDAAPATRIGQVSDETLLSIARDLSAED